MCQTLFGLADPARTLLPMVREADIDCDFRVHVPGDLRIRVFDSPPNDASLGSGQHAVLDLEDGRFVVTTLTPKSRR